MREGIVLRGRAPSMMEKTYGRISLGGGSIKMLYLSKNTGATLEKILHYKRVTPE